MGSIVRSKSPAPTKRAPKPKGPAKRALTGRALADLWPTLPHLSFAEAESFERDLAEARRKVGAVASKWD